MEKTVDEFEASDLPPDRAFATYKNTLHFANLDGLRFICISLVLWHHAIPLPLDTHQIFTRGFLGVDFFFVLSGFLITTLLLREAEKYGQFSLRNFYQRRLVRIVPVYFFVVTSIGIYYVIVQGQTEYLKLWPFYYVFLSNFLTEHIPLLSVTWSLSVEEQYYMIWPLILLTLPKRLLIPTCVALITVNFLISSGIYSVQAPSAGPLLFKLPNATYAPIIMGSLAAIVLDRPRGFALIYPLTRNYFTPLIGFLALFLFLAYSPNDVLGWPNLVIHLTMTFILVTLVVKEKSVLFPVLTFPPIARFGVVSYGIYLYHLLALDLFTRIGTPVFGPLNPWLVLVGYSLLSYLIAEISFRTLEAYFMRFRPKRPVT